MNSFSEEMLHAISTQKGFEIKLVELQDSQFSFPSKFRYQYLRCHSTKLFQKVPVIFLPVVHTKKELIVKTYSFTQENSTVSLFDKTCSQKTQSNNIRRPYSILRYQTRLT
jgi:hypothetical protein